MIRHNRSMALLGVSLITHQASELLFSDLCELLDRFSAFWLVDVLTVDFAKEFEITSSCRFSARLWIPKASKVSVAYAVLC